MFLVDKNMCLCFTLKRNNFFKKEKFIPLTLSLLFQLQKKILALPNPPDHCCYRGMTVCIRSPSGHRGRIQSNPQPILHASFITATSLNLRSLIFVTNLSTAYFQTQPLILWLFHCLSLLPLPGLPCDHFSHVLFFHSYYLAKLEPSKSNSPSALCLSLSN